MEPILLTKTLLAVVYMLVVTSSFKHQSFPNVLLVCIKITQGLSWSIGMDEGAQTLPNFLKNYRDDVVGGSVGNHTGEASRVDAISFDVAKYGML